MDFIFDNIVIIAFLVYAVVIVASKIVSGAGVEDEEEKKPYTPLPKNRPITKKKIQPARRRPTRDNTPPTNYDNPWTGIEIPTVIPQQIQPVVEKDIPIFNSTDIEKTYLSEIEKPTISAIENKKISSAKISKNKNEFSDILSDKNSLRRAFVASEILGKPKALRR